MADQHTTTGTDISAADHWLVRQNRRTKRTLALLADLFFLPLVMYLSFTIRLGSWQPGITKEELLLLIAAPAIGLPLLYLAGVYRTVIRFFNSDMLWRIFAATSATAILLTALLYWPHQHTVSGAAIIIFWALALLYLGGGRFLIKRHLYWQARQHDARTAVAIYGAGDCGVQLVLGLSAAFDYKPVLFIDDNNDLHGTLMHGVPVVGRNNLKQEFAKRGVKLALVAMPSISHSRWKEVITFLEQMEVGVKTAPSLPDMVAGKARPQDVRDIRIEDLLGREPVQPRPELMQAAITGHAVMVTGAGGSIGSELCRQILAQQPAKLVLFERNEYALYRIDQELRHQLAAQAGATEIISVLGSVTRREHIERVCRSQQVATLFHAAAYKHVPLVEANPVDGVRNNVLGTLRTALGAQAAGVRRFVLISTDKAVRPTNIMGASKRVAEMILQGLAEEASDTVFTMVRFGNVLGSSGSVVPLFRQQILTGGPVTLTHNEVTRYFMTIPEAAQLVIQAGAMAHGGEVFVLDMGKPIKIRNLAQRMIRLMGYTVRDAAHPDGDIEISVTGLRPGEKLYEELLLDEGSTLTSHPRIQQAKETHIPWRNLKDTLSSLDPIIKDYDPDYLILFLQNHVDGFLFAKQKNSNGQKSNQDCTESMLHQR